MGLSKQQADQFDLSTILNKHKDKALREKAITLMNDIDFVVRKHELTVSDVVGLLQAMAATYQRKAMRTTILKPKDDKDGKSKDSIIKS